MSASFHAVFSLVADNPKDFYIVYLYPPGYNLMTPRRCSVASPSAGCGWRRTSGASSWSRSNDQRTLRSFRWWSRKQRPAGQTDNGTSHSASASECPQVFKIRQISEPYSPIMLPWTQRVMLLAPTWTQAYICLHFVKSAPLKVSWTSRQQWCSVCSPGHRCVRRSAASGLRCSACTGHESWCWSADETTGSWEIIKIQTDDDVLTFTAAGNWLWSENAAMLHLWVT